MVRRAVWVAIAIAALVSGAAGQAPSEYPSAPVRIFVPFAAGGPTDVVTRILADLLSVRWGGKSIVVENRPGAGTIVSTAAVAKAAADGLTFGIATNSLLINPAIGVKLPYDTMKEIVGVAMIATQPHQLAADQSGDRRQAAL